MLIGLEKLVIGKTHLLNIFLPFYFILLYFILFCFSLFCSVLFYFALFYFFFFIFILSGRLSPQWLNKAKRRENTFLISASSSVNWAELCCLLRNTYIYYIYIIFFL